MTETVVIGDMTEVLPPAAELPALFDDSAKVDAVLAEIESRAKAHVPDVSTAKSRKEIASLGRKVSSSKVALDDAGKALTHDMRQKIGEVDAERRKIRERMDTLRDEVRAPLVEWEKAEHERKAKFEELMGELEIRSELGDNAEAIAADMQRIRAIVVGEGWLEYMKPGVERQIASLQELQQRLGLAREREREAERIAEERRREQAELAELRKEKAEREAKAEEERRLAAEEAAAAERVRLEHAAEEARKEREAELAAERAAAIEAAKAKAAEEERERLEAEAAKEAERVAKRADNERIRTRVIKEITEDLAEAGTMKHTTAELLALALANGKVRHVEVKF